MLGKGKIKDGEKMPYLGHDSFYLQCFYELSTTRNIGMGVGPIPINFIYDYVERFKLDHDFIDIILRVDSFYLELVNDATKTDKNYKGTGSKQ